MTEPLSFNTDYLEQALQERLSAIAVHVEDESHLHAGHVGARREGSHFRVTIASPRFSNLPKVKQHRLVYEALADELSTSIHALALKTYTPEQWQTLTEAEGK